MTSAVERILEFRISEKKILKKRHSITIGTPRFEKTTTALIKLSNVEGNQKNLFNILKIISLKSILKHLVPFVLKKTKEFIRILHITIIISVI